MLDIVLQFVGGEVGFVEFYRAYRKDERVLRCLEDAVAELAARDIPVTYDAVFRADPSFEGTSSEPVFTRRHPTVASKIEDLLKSDCSFAMKRAEIYDLVFSVVAAQAPETAYCHKYSDEFKFFLRAVPEYASGGEDACAYIEQTIIAALPPDLSEAKRVKLCKEQVRQRFHVEGNRHPRWVQSAEWPIVGGEPAKYVGCERSGDRVRYFFEDPATGRRVAVEQYA